MKEIKIRKINLSIFINVIICSILLALPKGLARTCESFYAPVTEFKATSGLPKNISIQALEAARNDVSSIKSFLQNSNLALKLSNVQITEDPYSLTLTGYAYRELKKVVVEIGTERPHFELSKGSFRFVLAHEIGHLILIQYLTKALAVPNAKSLDSLENDSRDPKIQFLADILVPFEEVFADLFATLFLNELKSNLIEPLGFRDFQINSPSPPPDIVNEYSMMYLSRREIGGAIANSNLVRDSKKIQFLELVARAISHAVKQSYSEGSLVDWNYEHLIKSTGGIHLNQSLTDEFKRELGNEKFH